MEYTSSKIQTAIHEAGHAVITVALKRRFKYVTIAEDDFSLGHVMPWGRDINNILRGLQGISQRILSQRTLDKNAKDEIIILYSGYLSQKETNFEGDAGFEDDKDKIISIALFHEGPGEAEKLIDKCERKAIKLIKENWMAITAVAEKLVMQQTVSYSEVKEIIKGLKAH